jgi:hypothetical protein
MLAGMAVLTHSSTAHTMHTVITTNTSVDELEWIRTFSSTVVDAIETEEACAAVDNQRIRRPHDTTSTTTIASSTSSHIGASTSAGT